MNTRLELKRIPLLFALFAIVALATACGGGGTSTAGAAEGVITEGEGSAPTVLPPDDSSAPDTPPPDSNWQTAVASTAEFRLTLSVSDPIDGPKAPLSGGRLPFTSPQPIWFFLELRNISGQPQTIQMLDTPFHQIDGYHEISMNHIWAKSALFVPPYSVTFAPDEARLFSLFWGPGGYELGPYAIEGKIATSDARVPGPIRLHLELR